MLCRSQALTEELAPCFGAQVNVDAANDVPSTAPNKKNFFGMHTLSPLRHWPSVDFASMRMSGVSWGDVEKTKGKYDWSALDAWTATARRHGSDLVYTFLNTPAWASSDPKQRCYRGNTGCAAPPKNIRDWDDFVAALTTRYKGEIANYELWNEPNVAIYWTGTYSQLLVMAQHAYAIIKSIDPQANVLTPSVAFGGWPTDAATWSSAYLGMGGAKYADVVAWHGYTARSDKAPVAESIVAEIDQLQTSMRAAHIDKPLWNTEGGWGKNNQLPVSDAQSAFLARWYILQFAKGVQRVYWYQWDNPNWGTLWESQKGLRLPGSTYRVIYDWITSSSPMGPCTSLPQGTWTCDIQYRSQPAKIVWNTNGPESYAVPSSLRVAYDLAGKASLIRSGAVIIGPKPKLLTR